MDFPHPPWVILESPSLSCHYQDFPGFWLGFPCSSWELLPSCPFVSVQNELFSSLELLWESLGCVFLELQGPTLAWSALSATCLYWATNTNLWLPSRLLGCDECSLVLGRALVKCFVMEVLSWLCVFTSYKTRARALLAQADFSTGLCFGSLTVPELLPVGRWRKSLPAALTKAFPMISSITAQPLWFPALTCQL